MGRKRHTPKPKMGEVTRTADGQSEVEWVSKSEMKREAARLDELANRLVRASNEELGAMDLPADLDGAVREARRLTHRDALQRQTRHVARLLQTVNAEPISALLDLHDPGSDTGQQIHRLTEQWRDRLTTDADAVTDLIEQFPDTDHQALRQSIRNARKASDQLASEPDDPGARDARRRQQRRLYQLLHPLVMEQVRTRH